MRMPFRELCEDPAQWAAAKRDVAAGRAVIERAATVTLDALILGLLDQRITDWLRVALRAVDGDPEANAMIDLATRRQAALLAHPRSERIQR